MEDSSLLPKLPEEAEEVPHFMDGLLEKYERTLAEAQSALDARKKYWSTILKSLTDNKAENEVAWQRHQELMERAEALEKEYINDTSKSLVNLRLLEAYQELEYTEYYHRKGDRKVMGGVYLDALTSSLKLRISTLETQSQKQKQENAEIDQKLYTILAGKGRFG